VYSCLVLSIIELHIGLKYSKINALIYLPDWIRFHWIFELLQVFTILQKLCSFYFFAVEEFYSGYCFATSAGYFSFFLH